MPSTYPRFLMLLVLPENNEEWLSQNAESLIMRKCMYYKSLEGAVASDNFSAVSVKIDSGMSVNFLESLSKIGISEKKSKIEIKAEWSPITPNEDVKTNVVCLSNEEEYDVVHSTIIQIRKREPETKEFYGKIEHLRSDSEKQERGGEITLLCLDNDKTKKIKATQSADMHSIAAKAYYDMKANIGKEIFVKMVASLNPDNNTWKCEEFEIVN
jgi:hypothetical protein